MKSLLGILKVCGVAMMLVVLMDAVCYGATPIEQRFQNSVVFSNVLGREYSVPMIRIATDPAAYTNSIKVYLRVTQPEDMTTNTDDTVTIDYLLDTLAFTGVTNYQPEDLVIYEGQSIFITNVVVVPITNSTLLYREE